MIDSKWFTSTYLLCISVFFLILISSGCAADKKMQEYSLENGRYVSRRSEEGQIERPYILIQDDKIIIIQYRARSYQPSGEIKRTENEIVMESLYADEEYRWVFQLIDNNTLKLLPDKSAFPEDSLDWKGEMIFSLELEDAMSE